MFGKRKRHEDYSVSECFEEAVRKMRCTVILADGDKVQYDGKRALARSVIDIATDEDNPPYVRLEAMRLITEFVR